MKLSWKIFKVALAFVIVIGAIFWAVNSIRPLSYTGTNLNFRVGSGPLTVVNSSDTSIPAQLIGPRSFSVASSIDGVSGAAVRQGSGGSTYAVEFDLPPGSSEFTITRGAEINFVADTTTDLQAMASPLTADSSRTNIIIAVIVVLGALFYASSVTGHSWLRRSSPQKDSAEADGPVTKLDDADLNRGRDGRMYSDT